ncbi:uncharacterized protein LOC115634333 [Scaptodrosophila lebanonensis]|uniref:Uncharacterized protein LOC115634333 n=1 Tax=Drosophila lebanonensis TaxID=7225 RepID=A0A6J2UHR1_DROLE|nr:uncharacterized protein LOC115634333 [Scaptodrosophila lebanonensis]
MYEEHEHSDDDDSDIISQTLTVRKNPMAKNRNLDHLLTAKEEFHVAPINEKDSVTESMEFCKKPSCTDADIQCVVDLVNATICEARAIIDSDPRGLFCYKYTEMQPGRSRSTASAAVDVLITKHSLANSEEKPKTIATFNVYTESVTTTSAYGHHWLTIDEFQYSNITSQIRNFIGEWKLSPNTMCVVLSNTRRQEVPIKGTIYFVDAHFSRPTPRCPNPLAVAKVRFMVSVSNVMQRHYPVMVTYRFEGHNTLYYALGPRAFNSTTFQRFFIDTILHKKLSFYAEICECRHGTLEKPKHNVKPKTKKRSAVL